MLILVYLPLFTCLRASILIFFFLVKQTHKLTYRSNTFFLSSTWQDLNPYIPLEQRRYQVLCLILCFTCFVRSFIQINQCFTRFIHSHRTLNFTCICNIMFCSSVVSNTFPKEVSNDPGRRGCIAYCMVWAMRTFGEGTFSTLHYYGESMQANKHSTATNIKLMIMVNKSMIPFESSTNNNWKVKLKHFIALSCSKANKTRDIYRYRLIKIKLKQWSPRGR